MAWSDIASIQIPSSKKNEPLSTWINAAVADQVFKKKFHGCKIGGSGTVTNVVPSDPTNTYYAMPVSSVTYDTDSFAHSSTGVIIPSGMAGLYVINYNCEFGPLPYPVRVTLGLNGAPNDLARGLGNIVSQTFRPNFNGDWQPTQIAYTIVLALNVGDVLELYTQLLDPSSGSSSYVATLSLAFLGFKNGPGHTYTRLRSINNPADFAKAPASWGNQVHENLMAQSEAVGFAREMLFAASAPTYVASAPPWRQATLLDWQIPPVVPQTNLWGLDWDPYNLMPTGQQSLVIPPQYAGAWLFCAHVQYQSRTAADSPENQTMFNVGIGTNNGSGWSTGLGRMEIGADMAPVFAPTTHTSDIILVTPGMAVMPATKFSSVISNQRNIEKMFVTAAWLGAEAS